MREFATRIIRAAGYLGLVRTALPRWLRIMVVVWVALAVFAPPPPLDAGATEFLGVALGVILWARYRPLLRVVWRAAASERQTGAGAAGCPDPPAPRTV